MSEVLALFPAPKQISAHAFEDLSAVSGQVESVEDSASEIPVVEIGKMCIRDRHKTGARGLRTICEDVLMDAMYELPDYHKPTRVVVRRSDIEGTTKPEIELLTKKRTAKK